MLLNMDPVVSLILQIRRIISDLGQSAGQTVSLNSGHSTALSSLNWTLIPLLMLSTRLKSGEAIIC